MAATAFRGLRDRPCCALSTDSRYEESAQAELELLGVVVLQEHEERQAKAALGKAARAVMTRRATIRKQLGGDLPWSRFCACAAPPIRTRIVPRAR